MAIVFEWLDRHSAAIWWVAIASAAMLGAAMLAVPWLVVRIPADHFARSRSGRSTSDGSRWPRWLGWLRWGWLLIKNLIGFALVILGCLMLVLPGQGILTILIGLAFLDFPGKHRLQHWVVSRRGVLQSINWLRRKADKDPLILG